MGGRRIALTIAAFTTIADAQPADPAGEIELEPAKDPRIARRWVAAGEQLMQRGSYFAARNRPDDAKAQFDNAVTAFQNALEAGDDPNVRFELAVAHDKLGRLADAVKQLRVVVAPRPGVAVRPDVLRKATAKLAELAAKIGLVTLTVAPAGASITLGGSELGTAPLREPLVLVPGTYTLAFQANGFHPKEAEITISAGSEVERTIELEPIQIIAAPVAPVQAEIIPAPPPRRSKLPLYLGAGLAGAGVVGAAVFGVLAVGEHSTFTDPTTSKLDRDDARDHGKRLALVADLSLGVAVVAAGFTTYWYFFKYRQTPRKPDERRPPPVDAKLDVLPWVQSQSGGVTIAGWF